MVTAVVLVLVVLVSVGSGGINSDISGSHSGYFRVFISVYPYCCIRVESGWASENRQATMHVLCVRNALLLLCYLLLLPLLLLLLLVVRRNALLLLCRTGTPRHAGAYRHHMYHTPMCTKRTGKRNRNVNARPTQSRRETGVILVNPDPPHFIIV